MIRCYSSLLLSTSIRNKWNVIKCVFSIFSSVRATHATNLYTNLFRIFHFSRNTSYHTHTVVEVIIISFSLAFCVHRIQSNCELITRCRLFLLLKSKTITNLPWCRLRCHTIRIHNVWNWAPRGKWQKKNLIATPFPPSFTLDLSGVSAVSCNT